MGTQREEGGGELESVLVLERDTKSDPFHNAYEVFRWQIS